ncbi:ABC transporter permease [Methylocapsa acidiphila]|uniref:ABC transporter permease n=1 Tax=Methylocapsa acidiphila TaxID=133552 RepID=UPI0004230B0B|nr:ABC transporter permease [Methylocapsa acidiphila]
MSLGALIAEAVAALRLSALRSALTAIGVIIGAAGIVVLGAAGGGANAKIEEQLNAMGTENLIVNAVKVENAGAHGPVALLTDEDAKAIAERVPEIQFVSREVYSNVTLVAGNASWTTQYWGVDASYADVFNVKIADGRFLDADDIRSGAKVVVLGPTVAQKLFGDQSPIGRSLRMGGAPVQVIGVRAKLGFVGGQDYDNFIITPITTARARLPKAAQASPHELDQIDTKVFPGSDRTAAKDAILALLRERKHIPASAQDRFTVFDTAQYVELMNATHSTLSWLLAATAAISLVVGGVGIMNIMLVSVTERTREIGLRRAIGARQRDILAQFLTEAIVLCAAAGFVGLALGVALSALVARTSGWPLIVTPQNMLLALAASVGVGVVFGYVPARKATALDPIEALRHD